MNNLIYKIKSILYKYSKEGKKYKRPSYEELKKFKNFQRSEKNKLILSFGAGRSGQNWCSKIFNSHKNWVGSAERYADYEAFFRFITFYKLPISKENFYELMILSIKRDMSLYQNTFISSPYFAFEVYEIVEKLNPNFVFFNIRDPISSIESFHKKGWYKFIDDFNNFQSPSIDITESQYRSFSRIIPTGDFLSKWCSLTRIGKITWFWATINRSIYDDFSKITKSDKYFLKLKDINQNYSKYKKLVEIFDLKDQLNHKDFLKIIDKAPNKGGENKYFYKEWSNKEKKEFSDILGEIFPYYDQINTNI